MGISTTVKSAQTTVVVDDHQTVVIGGLIEDRSTEGITKVPLLGDIPILGWLFKYRTRGKEKTNLVILLTPHIVRSAEEQRELSRRYNIRRLQHLEEATGGHYVDSPYIVPLMLPEGIATPEIFLNIEPGEGEMAPGPESWLVSPPSPEPMTPEPETSEEAEAAAAEPESATEATVDSTPEEGGGESSTETEATGSESATDGGEEGEGAGTP